MEYLMVLNVHRSYGQKLHKDQDFTRIVQHCISNACALA